MRKASTRLPEQGTQTPSPAPDLIPAETKNQPRTHIRIGTANGGTSNGPQQEDWSILNIDSDSWRDIAIALINGGEWDPEANSMRVNGASRSTGTIYSFEHFLHPGDVVGGGTDTSPEFASFFINKKARPDGNVLTFAIVSS